MLSSELGSMVKQSPQLHLRAYHVAKSTMKYNNTRLPAGLLFDCRSKEHKFTLPPDQSSSLPIPTQAAVHTIQAAEQTLRTRTITFYS